jgi:hypothetical protein
MRGQRADRGPDGRYLNVTPARLVDAMRTLRSG